MRDNVSVDGRANASETARRQNGTVRDIRGTQTQIHSLCDAGCRKRNAISAHRLETAQNIQQGSPVSRRTRAPRATKMTVTDPAAI